MQWIKIERAVDAADAAASHLCGDNNRAGRYFRPRSDIEGMEAMDGRAALLRESFDINRAAVAINGRRAGYANRGSDRGTAHLDRKRDGHRFLTCAMRSI